VLLDFFLGSINDDLDFLNYFWEVSKDSLELSLGVLDDILD